MTYVTELLIDTNDSLKPNKADSDVTDRIIDKSPPCDNDIESPCDESLRHEEQEEQQKCHAITLTKSISRPKRNVNVSVQEGRSVTVDKRVKQARREDGATFGIRNLQAVAIGSPRAEAYSEEHGVIPSFMYRNDKMTAELAATEVDTKGLKKAASKEAAKNKRCQEEHLHGFGSKNTT